ncbi:hypothetical protein OIU35_15295 [Boseaceae bacterium BT-24-1]|nr:hypothetical protein [Boseaceae bacterium BT-24-1]
MMKLSIFMAAGIMLSACAERQEAFHSKYRDLSASRARTDADMSADEAACRFQINSLPDSRSTNAELLTDCMLARKWETVERRSVFVKTGFGL